MESSMAFPVTEGPVTPQQRVQLEIKLKPRPAEMGPNSDPLATGLSRVSLVSPGDPWYVQGNPLVRSGEPSGTFRIHPEE